MGDDGSHGLLTFAVGHAMRRVDAAGGGVDEGRGGVLRVGVDLVGGGEETEELIEKRCRKAGWGGRGTSGEARIGLVPAEQLLRPQLDRGSSNIASAEPDANRRGCDEDLADLTAAWRGAIPALMGV